MNSRKYKSKKSGSSHGGGNRAVIDIGSNTVRMVIYGGSPRAPTILMNEKVTARLGRDLSETGKMGEESIQLAMGGLARYALILEDLEIEDVETVATAAVRDAKNGKSFLGLVESVGLKPRLISGEEEARTSALGVIGAFPERDGVVADLGGGSLELVAIRNGKPGAGVSLPLGSLRLAAVLEEGGEDALGELIDKALHDAGWDHSIEGPLFMVGGTWRAMALYSMWKDDHPLSDPHGLALDANEAAKLAKIISRGKPEDFREVQRISSMRSAILPGAATLLRALLKRLSPEGLVFSSWGLREGLLYSRLDPAEMGQNPLLAGVGHFAAQHGASSTKAAQVAGWTVGALPAQRHGTERLRLAATMLALASLQVEPNLRVQHAVEWALYKRWLDLDDFGRGMMAATILGNGGRTEIPELISSLAPRDRLDEAINWGLAIRLCRRLGAQSRKSLNCTMLTVSGEELQLVLRRSHAALYGQPTKKDLKQLAERMGLTPKVEILPKEEFSTLRDDIADRKWSAAMSAK